MIRSNVELAYDKCINVQSIKCPICGNRLTLTTSGRRKVDANGNVIHGARARYQCHYNVRHPGQCDGQSGYGVTKVDGMVDEVIRIKFAQIKASAKGEILVRQQQRGVEQARKRVQATKDQLAEKEKDLDDFKGEVIKAIRGTSKLGIDILNSLIEGTQGEIEKGQERIRKAEEEYLALCADTKRQQTEYDQLLTWADLYDKCSKDAKKMIIAQFVKSVHVGRDYNITINFNVSFEEFNACIMKNGAVEIEDCAS